MNKNIEEQFVNIYVKREYQERILFELKDISGTKPKRRCKAFRKFSHNAITYLKENKILLVDNKITEDIIISTLKLKASNKKCYYMDEFGGEELPLLTALENQFNDYGAVIVIFEDKFAIVKEETSIGSPKKIILVNK